MPDDIDDFDEREARDVNKQRVPKFPMLRKKRESPRPKAAPRAARESEKPEDDWIEVLLLDDEGTPILAERCRITTPDGRTQDYFTDLAGLIRIDGLSPGECLISFPDLDAEAPRGAGASVRAARTPGAEDSALPGDAAGDDWLEIVLVDEDDQPVSDARCRTASPDGAIEEHRTNSEGVIRLEQLISGEYIVTFLDVETPTLI